MSSDLIANVLVLIGIDLLSVGAWLGGRTQDAY